MNKKKTERSPMARDSVKTQPIAFRAPLTNALKLKKLAKEYTFNRSVLLNKMLENALRMLDDGDLSILSR